MCLRTVLLLGALLAAGRPGAVSACSRVLWADNGQAVVVGRNMDWALPMAADLWVLPRGIQRDGMAGPGSLTWTARHGSVVAVSAGAASDGLNEQGLAGHLLWLAESEYGAPDGNQPKLGVGVWLQYYLDNFATVKEAVEFTQSVRPQIVTGKFDDRKVTVHLALEDATGDSVIIEYLDGTPKVFHGRQYTVMTNSPPFDEQLQRLTQYQGFGGAQPLPGTTEAADRFVRAAYYLKHLPQAANLREAVAGVLSVMRNVSQPFGTPDPNRPNISATRWRTVCDLTNRVYYFESTTSPNIIWVRLAPLDFAAGSGIRKLDLIGHPDRVGDCTDQFEPAQPFVVPPVDLSLGR